MKKIYLTMAIAALSFCSYAQSYLPLTAGSGSPLTNTLFVIASPFTGVAYQFDGTAYGGKKWALGDGTTINGTFAIRDLNAGADRLSISTNGNVGIGTTSPGDLLQVNNGSIMRFQVASTLGVWVNNEVNGGTLSSPGPLYINYSSTGNTLLNSNGGNVGIGITSPGDLLQVNNGPTMRFQVSAAHGIWTNNEVNGGTPSSPGALYLNFSSIGNTLLNSNGGNVGIGTNTPDARLAVAGTVHAKEVRVDLTGWPDYVFESAYHLPTLTEVKTYIDKNNHLPEMPSAEQVAKAGLSLGDMNAKLLKKVEELTLYLIDKDKQDKEKEIRLSLQQKQLVAQQKQINQFNQKLSIITRAQNKK